MLAFFADMARCSQTGRRPTGPPTLPNDLPNSSRNSSNVASAAAGLADTTRSRFPEILGDARVEYLSEPPSHGVSRYRVADLPGDGEPEPRGAMLVWKGVHGEEPAPVSGALTVDPLELRASRSDACACSGQRSDCQTLAAPAPAVSDDPAPAHRAHALAKAVRLRPLAAIWLISTLHWTPLQALRSIQYDRREYIRSRQRHPAISRRKVRPREHDTTRSRLAEKCCKMAFSMCACSRVVHHSHTASELHRCVGLMQHPNGEISMRVIHRLWITSVDNHVNCLQKLVL